MDELLPKRDPGGAHARKVRAARRVGVNSRCACGETRPEALIPKKKPTICAACDREKRGRTSMDNHHVFGKANSPITVSMSVNDHRAELSSAQYDWPKETLENRHRSPLLAGAGCIRGFVDTVVYLIRKGLLWVAEALERLDALLLEALGPNWWLGTELEQFAPKSDRRNE